MYKCVYRGIADEPIMTARTANDYFAKEENYSVPSLLLQWRFYIRTVVSSTTFRASPSSIPAQDGGAKKTVHKSVGIMNGEKLLLRLTSGEGKKTRRQRVYSVWNVERTL